MTGTVKALEWPDECRRGQRVTSKNGLLQYTIAHYGGSTDDSGTVFRWAKEREAWSTDFSAYEQAIAAAQADYERRILSALTASASEPAISDAQISTVWQGAITVALNLIIKRQNDLNDDDGPMAVLNEQGEIIARLRQFLTPDASYIEELRTILPACPVPASEPEPVADEDAIVEAAAIQALEWEDLKATIRHAKAGTAGHATQRDWKVATDAARYALSHVSWLNRPVPTPDGAVEALREAIDVLDGLNDDEISVELLPRLRTALSHPADGWRGPFDNLSHIVQYRRADGSQRWTTMAAFDSERVAEKYRNDCSSTSTPWEYRVIAAPAAKPEGE